MYTGSAPGSRLHTDALQCTTGGVLLRKGPAQRDSVANDEFMSGDEILTWDLGAIEYCSASSPKGLVSGVEEIRLSCRCGLTCRC